MKYDHENVRVLVPCIIIYTEKDHAGNVGVTTYARTESGRVNQVSMAASSLEDALSKGKAELQLSEATLSYLKELEARLQDDRYTYVIQRYDVSRAVSKEWGAGRKFIGVR